MARIETLDSALRNRRHEVSEVVAEKFWPSVRAMLYSKDGRNPEIVGSCTLLQIDGRRFVVTAAHLLDGLETHEIYVSGSVGTEPVQIIGMTYSTASPPQGRDHDKIDIGFWGIEEPLAEKLGAVSFIVSNRFSLNRAPFENRMFVALGYPVSRNKRNIDHVRKSIKTTLSKYTAELDCDPSVPKAFGVSGNDHLFLKHHKYSETATGEKQRTFKPVGLSGGPLIDLGNFATLDRYASDTTISGYVSGMIIERFAKHKVLVATRIHRIVEAIMAQGAP